jgi:hypothetical protein
MLNSAARSLLVLLLGAGMEAGHDECAPWSPSRRSTVLVSFTSERLRAIGGRRAAMTADLAAPQRCLPTISPAPRKRRQRGLRSVVDSVPAPRPSGPWLADHNTAL